MKNLWSKQVLREGRFLVRGKHQDFNKSFLLTLVSNFKANPLQRSGTGSIVRDSGPRLGGRLLELEYREGLGLWGIFSLSDDLVTLVEKDPSIGVEAIFNRSDSRPLQIVVGVDPAPIAGLSHWHKVEETAMPDSQTQTALTATQRLALVGRVANKLATIKSENSPTNDALLLKLYRLASGTETQEQANPSREVALSNGNGGSNVRDFSNAQANSYTPEAISRMTKFVAAKTGLGMTGESDAEVIKVTSQLCDQGSPEQRLRNWVEAMGDDSNISDVASQEDIRAWIDDRAI